jgi:hypothetical protein
VQELISKREDQTLEFAIRGDSLWVRGKEYQLKHMHSIVIRGPKRDDTHNVEFEYADHTESFLGMRYLPWETIEIDSRTKAEIDTLKESLKGRAINIVEVSSVVTLIRGWH